MNECGGVMEQFEARFKQVDVLPLVKYYMDELNLLNLFTKYVPAANGSLAGHAESLCIINTFATKQPFSPHESVLTQESSQITAQY